MTDNNKPSASKETKEKETVIAQPQSASAPPASTPPVNENLDTSGNKPSTKSKKSSLLIALLLAVVTIGVLSTLFVSNIKKAEAKARDIQRKNDLKQIQGALEVYKEDNGKYPDGLNYLESRYMQEIPEDPLDKEPHVYIYTPGPGPDEYTLTAVLENLGDIECSGGSECVITLTGF